MIWKRKDPAQDHFVSFDHHEQRIAQLATAVAALEAAMAERDAALLAFLEADIASPWLPAAKRLADLLRKRVGAA
jgi:hypothetical protein